MKYHPIYEFTLNVPAEKAWALLEDFDNYSTWNSAITFRERLVVGKTVIMKVGLAGRKINTPIKVLAIKKNQELRWKGGPRGLITGEHYFLIEAINDNTCKMIQGEKFSGVLLPILWPFLKKSLNILYKQTNEDIKTALI